VKRWVRLSPEEDAVLVAQAKKGGLTISDELRRGIGLKPRTPPYDMILLTKIFNRQGPIGSNVNQVARVLNQGGYAEAAAFEQAVRDNAWIRDTLDKAIRNEQPC
jgi:hypothetical protein